MPIQELHLKGSSVSDLRPLEGLALTYLDLSETPVTDLTPLSDPILSASLKMLRIWRIPAKDLSPLAACKNLVELDASETTLVDLELVRGQKLRLIQLIATKVADISALAGMPLTKVTLADTAVTDISPLLQCPTLTQIVLPGGARDVGALHALPALERLSFRYRAAGEPMQSITEFWLEYEYGGSITSEAMPMLAEESAKSSLYGLKTLEVGVLQLWFGRESDYFQTCQRMLAWSAKATSPDDLEKTAKLIVLRPGNDPSQYEAALMLARRSVEIGENNPWLAYFHVTLGMAEYRSGNFAKAVEELAAGVQMGPNLEYLDTLGGFYQAMCLFQQNKLEEARALFDATEAKMTPFPPDPRKLPPGIRLDEIISWLACKEAAELLKIPLQNGLRPIVAVLLPPTSEWKWLHPLDGSDPATNEPSFATTFFAPDYDERAWRTGRDSAGPAGGFGYGDAGFAGVDIGTPAALELGHAAYFRTRFITEKPHAGLELRCRRDDGIIVYLDGKELARDNMTAGPEAYLLPAAQAIDGPGETAVQRVPLPGVSLAAGEHFLAISLHNPANSSSDLRIGGVTLVALDPEPAPAR